MAKLHTVKPKHIPSEKSALFDKLREWLKIIPDDFTDPAMNAKYNHLNIKLDAVL